MRTSSTRSELPRVYIGRLTNVLRLNVRKTCGDLRRLAETPKLSSLNNGLPRPPRLLRNHGCLFPQVKDWFIRNSRARWHWYNSQPEDAMRGLMRTREFP